MKASITAVLLMFIIGNIGALDIESYQFIDHLRAITEPQRPEIYEDGVIFTASASHLRVGISFAHEGYAKVHWFQRLFVPRDAADMLDADGKPIKGMDPNIATGIMFHVEIIPANLANMDYRLIIDGLWTSDPMNPYTVSGPSGVVESRIPLPQPTARVAAASSGVPPGSYRFSYTAPPGETITVGGTFNNWDPFMYTLRETYPGYYTLTIPLPPGSFQYVFFYRGERVFDPANPRMLYTKDGRIVSEASPAPLN